MDKPIYLYITRHGETLFNVKTYAQGWCDSPLTEEGILSAKRLGEGFKKDNILFDAIYSSPFTRAYETTEYICEAMNLNLPIQRCALLKEVNFGIWEGELDVIRFKALGYIPFSENVMHVDGESFDDLYERITTFLQKVVEEQSDNQNILIVTHGVWLMMFLTRMFGWDARRDGGIRNTSVTTIKYQDGNFEVVKIGDRSYQE